MTRMTDNNPGRAKIQQLLAVIGSKAPDDSKQIEASEYDWHQPHFFNSRQMKKLTALASSLAELIAEKFAALCQHSFEVKISSTSEHFAGQFLGQDTASQGKGPVNYYLSFCTDEREPCGFVSIPPQTAKLWTTQLLGDTESKEDANRHISELEASLLFDMASLIVEAVAEAGDKCGFHPADDAITDSLPLQLKGAEEFCKITFQVRESDSETGSEAHILIFCDKLAPIVAESAQAADKLSAKDIARAIQNHIEEISIPITAQLASVAVTVEQVLDKKIDEPVLLLAAGRTLFRGRCAQSGGKYAVAITEAAFEKK